jgi:hypothetical protein
MVKGPLSRAMGGRSRWQVVESRVGDLRPIGVRWRETRAQCWETRAQHRATRARSCDLFWHLARFQYSQNGRGARGFLTFGNWLLRDQLPEVVCCSHVECIFRFWKTCGMLFFDPKVKIARMSAQFWGMVRINAQSSS